LIRARKANLIAKAAESAAEIAEKEP